VPPRGSWTEYLVDRAMRERNDEQVAVRAGMDIGADSKSDPEEQAFALGDVVLGEIIGDTVFQARIAHGDVAAVAGEVESKELSAQQGRRRGANNHVALILRPERAT